MIDSHAHLYLCEASTEAIVQRALDVGVSAMVNVGIDLQKSQLAIDEADKFESVYATVGIHPCEARSFDLNTIEALTQLATHPKVVAIGEIGLDYYHDDSFKAIQTEALNAQMALARLLAKPVIIHTRHADEDIVEIMKAYPDVRKVFHCFASSPEVAQTLDGENTFFSFTAMVTFAKKGKVINALKWVPIDKLMIETDCPYLAPASRRGTQNEPSFLPELVARIAELKSISPEDVVLQTTQTAMGFFGLR